MIDLSLMRAVTVDAKARTARVEGGATLADLDGATQKFGARDARRHQLDDRRRRPDARRRLRLAEPQPGADDRQPASRPTWSPADGQRVTASATSHPDLFWGIRGGGGNFGVVASFEFRLHPVGPDVLSGLIVHPLAAARDVLRFYRDFLAKAPEQFVCWFVMRKAPPLPFLPPEWHGKEILALAACYCGDIAEGETRGQAAARVRQADRRRHRAASVPGLADDSRSAAHAGHAQLLEVARLPRAQRRPDRRLRRLREPPSRSADRDRVRAARRRGQPRAARGDRLHAPRRAVRHERPRSLGDAGQGRGVHRLGPRALPGGGAVRHRRRLRELHDPGRAGPRARGLRRRTTSASSI